MVAASGVEPEVADQLVVANDRGVVLVDDDRDGAADPFCSDSDLHVGEVHDTAGVDDGGVTVGSRVRVWERITGP